MFFGHFIFFVKIPKYENLIEGNYYISDTTYLNRSQNTIYPENKYILKGVNSENKVVVSCSMLLDKCNMNKVNDLVFVKYVNSCSRITCNKFIYEINGGGVKLNSNYFKNKYVDERNHMNIFLILYVLPSFAFLLFFLIFYYRLSNV